ncbi:MAG: MotA/TolQ/ExbB proton channel family protein [Gammaproteobacteria bacterium]|nr:MotA/TolQ/ExbB proton channel family protein [Gammaproteobacteria bacterium]
MEHSLGFSHFLSQADAVGKTVLILLLLLSVASWYLMITKYVQNFVARRRADAFLAQFWNAESLEEITSIEEKVGANNAFARLAREACNAAQKNHRGKQKLAAAGGINEYLTRVLRNAIDQETARAEHGLTLLASAGSASPYIGLFGTVWGIYHALVSIGLAGQGTLDKVAGPVGEALIMTALGLAVAIPAVLAYNYFTRCNRLRLAKLEAFAHDLITLMTVELDDLEPSQGTAPRLLRAVGSAAT